MTRSEHPMKRPCILALAALMFNSTAVFASRLPYTVVDTGQTKCYSNIQQITAPNPGQPWYGQDPQYSGPALAYTDNGDGTITDLNTGLMWVQARGSKIAWDAAVAGVSTHRTAGYADWRMPTIKEIYSLIQFNGINGPDNTTTNRRSPTWFSSVGIMQTVKMKSSTVG